MGKLMVGKGYLVRFVCVDRHSVPPYFTDQIITHFLVCEVEEGTSSQQEFMFFV